MAKTKFEKSMEKYKKDVEKIYKQKIQADKKIADRQLREEKAHMRSEERRNRASTIVNGQPTVGGIRILDRTAEELVGIICVGYKGDDYKVKNGDIEIPEYIREDLGLEFEKLKQYGLISKYYFNIVGYWEITILPSLLLYFQDKEKAMNQEQRTNSFTNNFYGDVSDIQIQQGTTNSTQIKSENNEFDYEAVGKIIEQIKKYDGMLDTEFGMCATELREKVEEISSLVQCQENPSRIKLLLDDIKNLAIGVGGSLIASGITGLLQGLTF